MNILVEILKTGDDPVLALLAAGAVVLAFILIAVYIALDTKDAKKRRGRLTRVRPDASAEAAAPTVNVKRETAYSSNEAIDQLIKRFFPNPAKLRDRLARTGYKISLGHYCLGCLIVGILGTVGTFTGLAFPPLAAILAGVVIGIGLPHLIVGILGRMRVNKFIALFPEAIDLIVRGLKSGLPITEGVKIVGRELGDPVGAEFRQMSDAIKFGTTLTDALWGAADRIDTPEYRFFVISLSIQQETGGNLAETLENLSKVLRRRRQMKLKIKAFSSEAKASAYIIGSLPFIMFGIILMMNYAYAIMLLTDPRGNLMVAAGLVCYMVGIGIMYKMVKFEI